MKDQLQISANIQIAKQPEEVFEAIINPEKMKNYFISESSGRMEEGKNLEWKFPEFDEKVSIKVVQITPNEYISYLWEGAEAKQLLVEFTLVGISGSSTLVKVTEGKMEPNEAGIKWLGQNSEGWANFLACLKAYLEYGINLRKGAFDFLRE